MSPESVETPSTMKHQTLVGSPGQSETVPSPPPHWPEVAETSKSTVRYSSLHSAQLSHKPIPNLDIFSPLDLQAN